MEAGEGAGPQGSGGRGQVYNLIRQRQRILDKALTVDGVGFLQVHSSRGFFH